MSKDEHKQLRKEHNPVYKDIDQDEEYHDISYQRLSVFKVLSNVNAENPIEYQEDASFIKDFQEMNLLSLVGSYLKLQHQCK